MGYGYNGRVPGKTPAKPKIEKNPLEMQFPFLPGFFPWIFLLQFLLPYMGFGGFGDGFDGFFGKRGKK